MSRAERLYLYFVSLVSLSMLAGAAIVALRLVLKELGVGPAAAGVGRDADQDLLSLAIAVGAVGLVIWFFHWRAVERAVRLPAMAADDLAGTAVAADAAVFERRSIVRSFYFASVLATVLTPAAFLATQLAGRVVADVLNVGQDRGSFSIVSFSLVDDAWSLSIIAVLSAIWGYHAWIRNRDVRQGPVITGAAAWVSRLYLYWAAFLGLAYVLINLGSIVTVILGEWARSGSPSSSMISVDAMIYGGWSRAVIMCLVAIAIWGAVWLGHWLYSNRLRSGTTEQSAAERVSRVRLAYLIGVVAYGCTVVLSGAASSLSVVLSELSDAGLYEGSSIPLWYSVIAPSLAAVFAGIAWWWHRRRALAEDADGPAGVSAARVAGYTVALIGLAALTMGLAQVLSSILGESFARREQLPFDSGLVRPMWKIMVAIYGAIAVVGLAVWLAPWLFAQGRRARGVDGRETEIGSSSRHYYLFSVGAATIVVGAVALAMILYRCLRAAFGLPEETLGSEISGPLGVLLVAGAVYAYHRFVLRSDRTAPQDPSPIAG